MYLFGFYKFKNPELELPISLTPIILLSLYTRLNKIEAQPKKTIMQTLKKFTPTIHSLIYIFIVQI